MADLSDLPDDMPDFVKAQIGRQRDQHDMYHAQISDMNHALERNMQELTGDQKMFWGTYFGQLLGMDDPTAALAAMASDLNRLAAIELNLCPACGKDHDAELAALTEMHVETEIKHAPEPQQGPPPIEMEGPLADGEVLHELNGEMEMPPDLYSEPEGRAFEPWEVAGSDARNDIMRRFHVEQMPGKRNTVWCTNPLDHTGKRICHMEFPSLADRMMKEPDECPRCVEASKWG